MSGAAGSDDIPVRAGTMMPFEEQAVAIGCQGDRMVAVLNLPQEPNSRGVLIVVGGPQYRAGSHRQFALLARYLAERGIPALRFDYRGMGDSEGEARTFEEVDLDLRCALDAFFAHTPGLRDVALWGLCDAASAVLFYAHRDARVKGLALLNPWVRTAEGIARAHLRHYYLSRLVDPELWRKLGRGEFDFLGAGKSLAGTVGQVLAAGRIEREPAQSVQATLPSGRPLPARMADGLRRFRGRTLFILSGDDLTAQEFKDTVRRSKRWRELLDSPRVTWRDLPEANHTFSRREWRDQVAAWTADWVRSW